MILKKNRLGDRCSEDDVLPEITAIFISMLL